MNKNIRQSSYYSYRRLLSYNGVYNFVLGGRGIGKTYGAVKQAINDSLRKGHEFVYVRRYVEELKMAKATFFEAVAHEFPQHEFRVNGWFAEAAAALPDGFEHLEPKEQKQLMKEREWKVIGYFIALSTAQKMKSVSFPRVRKMVYDEFILEKGLTRYLPQEYAVFNSLYETIDRKRGDTKAVFIANAVSIDNPYFVHYGIAPDDASREILVPELKIEDVDATGFIVVHFPESAGYQADAKKTRYGKFLAATDPEYAAYAIGNQFKDNSKHLIGQKPYKADPLYTLETIKGTFSVWNQVGSPIFYVQSKLPGNVPLYTMIPERMSVGRIFLEPNSKQLGYIRSSWRRGNVYFDKPGTRVAFMEVFHK